MRRWCVVLPFQPVTATVKAQIENEIERAQKEEWVVKLAKNPTCFLSRVPLELQQHLQKYATHEMILDGPMFMPFSTSESMEALIARAQQMLHSPTKDRLFFGSGRPIVRADSIEKRQLIFLGDAISVIPRVDPRQPCLRTFVFGYSQVGKTALLTQFAAQTSAFYNTQHMFSIDCRPVQWSCDDYPSEEWIRDRNARSNVDVTLFDRSHRHADAVLLVFALDNRTSFESVSTSLLHMIQSLPVILIGNKSDLVRVVTLAEISELIETARRSGHLSSVQYFETSALLPDQYRHTEAAFAAALAAALKERIARGKPIEAGPITEEEKNIMAAEKERERARQKHESGCIVS